MFCRKNALSYISERLTKLYTCCLAARVAVKVKCALYIVSNKTMKILVFLSFAFCLASAADLQEAETHTTGRATLSIKNANLIPISQKQEPQYYSTAQFQQSQQSQQQYYPLQFVQTSAYQQPQHQQPAMIIIAQPSQVNQQHLLTTAAQQLLQYFHSNPQARIQFLQGNFIPNAAQAQPQYVPQQQSPYYQLMTVHQTPYQLPQTQYSPIQTSQTPLQAQHSPSYTLQSNQDAYTQGIGSQGVGSHGIVSQGIGSQGIGSQGIGSQGIGSQGIGSKGSQFQYPTIGPFGHTTSLSHISALAQLTAQKYVPSVPLRSPTPIITGLENFTPEQQAQIKAQLSAGGPITPLKSSAPLNTAALTQALSSQSGKAQDTGPQEFAAADDTKSTTQTENQNTNYNYNTYNTKG